ncbi:MAG: DUF697 domain-containing protein [Cyanobacteria bacterium P01_D01_bin.123]
MTAHVRQAMPLAVAIGGLVCLNGVTGSIAHLYDSVAPYSPALANGLSALLILGSLGLLGTAGWWWRSLRSGAEAKPHRPRRILKATPARIERELAKAEQAIAKLHDEVIRRSLTKRVRAARTDVKSERLRLVMFGTSSAGKTSAIAALLGHHAGETAPTLGTTTRGRTHTYTLPGFGGDIDLIDTPGLQTVGACGEAEAKQLVTKADLVVFVAAEDIDAIEFAALQLLSQQCKRTILALNKTDCRLPADNQLILERLREKTQPWMPTENVVEIAAAPAPMAVRHVADDGSVTETEVPREPDVRSLTERVGKILQREGKQLHLAAAMVRAQNLAASVDTAISRDRRGRAERVVRRMQWATAGAVAATPLPVLDLVAAAAMNARTITELHDIYEREISFEQAQKMARVLGKLLLKLGGAELASQAVGSLLKATPLAAAGVTLQAASAAYLTRVAGLSYLDWLESETPWNERTMLARLRSQLQHVNRTKFIRQAVAQTLKLMRAKEEQPIVRKRKPSAQKSRTVRALPAATAEPLALPVRESSPRRVERVGDRAS